MQNNYNASLFNADDNDAIIERINKLSSSSPAKWGKMNVAQMLVHCQQPLKVATGELVLKHSFIGFLFGKMMKKKFLHGKEFAKNLPTDKSFIISDAREFEKEKATLIAQIIPYKIQGTSIIKNEKHPFFGKMTPDEWAALSWKHLDHHLMQFEV